MHFARRYTDSQVSPISPRSAAATPPIAYHVRLRLRTALEIDWDQSGPARIGRLLTAALNEHAGGQRRIGTVSINLEWSLAWQPWTQASNGHERALGVSVVPDEVLARAHSDGMFVGGFEINRVLFKQSIFGAALAPAATSHTPARARARSSAGHELGHAAGLHDDDLHRDTTMYFRALTAGQARGITQRWTDAELRAALINILPADCLPPGL